MQQNISYRLQFYLRDDFMENLIPLSWGKNHSKRLISWRYYIAKIIPLNSQDKQWWEDFHNLLLVGKLKTNKYGRQIKAWFRKIR